MAALALLSAGPTAADPLPRDISAAGATCRAGSHLMARVDLYFGGRPGDTRAWRRFVARIVTPRFPDGLTVLDGVGQWRDRTELLREATHVLVVYYAPDASADAKIEAIREAYKSRFRQKSVLRADSTACVGF